jgi:hypothetical protein
VEADALARRLELAEYNRIVFIVLQLCIVGQTGRPINPKKPDRCLPSVGPEGKMSVHLAPLQATRRRRRREVLNQRIGHGAIYVKGGRS